MIFIVLAISEAVMPGLPSISFTAWSARVPPRRRRRFFPPLGFFRPEPLGLTGRRPGRAAIGFAAELGEGALEALALVVQLGEALLDQVAGLVEYVSGAGHLVPFVRSHRAHRIT